jgi:site-specific recombinase XerD
MVRRRSPDPPRTSRTRWDEVDGHDVQRWLVHLLTRYSDAYASNQFRALQQFFRWLAEEEQLPDPMARLRAPKVSEKLVPVFTSEELSALEKTCQGRTFAKRRDAAIIAVLTATGIRAGELAGIRYDPCDPRRSDVDLWRREITVRGKGGRPRVVRIGHDAARALDRYLRVRLRHAQAHRPQLWLGVNNRGPMTANGIYQMIARRGRQAGVDAWTHRFRHHFSHTWLDRGGAEGDLMELNGWSSPQMLPHVLLTCVSLNYERTSQLKSLPSRGGGPRTCPGNDSQQVHKGRDRNPSATESRHAVLNGLLSFSSLLLVTSGFASSRFS